MLFGFPSGFLSFFWQSMQININGKARRARALQVLPRPLDSLSPPVFVKASLGIQTSSEELLWGVLRGLSSFSESVWMSRACLAL